MAEKAGAWERERRKKYAMVVEADGGEDVDGDDENSFDYSWGQVHRGKHRGIRRGQRHEAMVGQANDRSSGAGGIDMSTKRAHLRSHSDACVAGVGDNMKVPDVGKATVGQRAC
jgi:hypothetical protein